MKSFFYYQISKFNILMAFCTFCISVFSIPVSASPDQVCTKTSSGQVVCGTPVEKPTNGSTSNSQDYPTQVSTVGILALELKSCAREKYNIISCVVWFNTSQDVLIYMHVDRDTKLVDNDGYEYAPTSVSSLKKVASSKTSFEFHLVPNVEYKATINFGNIPASAKYASLLQIDVNGQTGGNVQFRNVPFIELDGKIGEVPLPARHKTDITDTQPSNNLSIPIKKPKVCLPFVGCV